MSKFIKIYVDVILFYKKVGGMIPLFVVWEDGRRFKIEKVIKIDRAAVQSGGLAKRYTCIIKGQQKNLYLGNDNKWFFEQELNG